MYRHKYVSPSVNISRDLTVIILCLLMDLSHPVDTFLI